MRAIAEKYYKRFELLWRFYQGGIVNAAFGYGVYSIFVFAGMGIYLAQIISHMLGMIFNYVIFTRYVFRSSGVSYFRYIAAYAVNYVVGLAFLALFSLLTSEKYLVGLLALIATSLLNFVILRFFVFRPKVTDRDVG